MGLYLNPNAEAFKDDRNTRIYIDKSLVVAELNKLLSSKEDSIPKTAWSHTANARWT